MKRSASSLVIALFLLVDWSTCTPALAQAEATTEAFAREVERVLPEENLYDYHKRLSEGPCTWRGGTRKSASSRRAGAARAGLEAGLAPAELAHAPGCGAGLPGLSGKVDAGASRVGRPGSMEGWRRPDRSIVVGTRDQLPGCGTTLKAPKDYESSPRRSGSWYVATTSGERCTGCITWKPG